MRLIMILFLSLLGLSARAQCVGENMIDALGQDDRARLDAAIATHPYPSGNLWRAQNESSTIHIMGTLHLDDPRLDAYLEPLWPIIEGSDLILVEANRETAEQLKTHMASDPSLMFITDGPTLPEQLSEQDWQDLSEQMSARGVPGFMASKMRPWFVSMMLSIPPCAMAGMAEQNGVDFRIMDVADQAGIPTRSLEPYDTLFALFNSESPEDELNAIRLAMVTTQNGDAVISTLIDAYLSGEHRAIWELNRLLTLQTSGLTVEEATNMFNEMEAPLLTDRNISWMDVILPAAKEANNITVAVGAAHLSGEQGLLYMLEQSGYSLTRLDGF